jgi:hypothetical protein
MRYIGVRSSKCLPVEDTKYWGSSKHLPKDVASTHIKIIIKEHQTRIEAVAHEVLMHELNDVAVNPMFYNKAKQLVTGFDTSGTTVREDVKKRIANTLKGRVITEEHQAKITAALLGRVFSEEHRENLSKAHKEICARPGYVNPRKGVEVSEESRKKNSASKKADPRPLHIKSPRFKPWFITDLNNSITHLFYTLTKQEYALQCNVNPGTYRDLATKSKGVKALARGKYKGLIVGNIPT